MGNLFQCQNTVPVENVDPLAGTLRIVSNVLGDIANTTYFGNQPLIKVAPSLISGHDITVVHEVCGIVQTSDPKTVQPWRVSAKWSSRCTTATRQSRYQFVQLMEHEYDEWGTCPTGGDALQIDLPDGQVTEIVAVDAGAVGCLPSGADPSTASPMTLACRRDTLLLLGKSTGPQLPYHIG